MSGISSGWVGAWKSSGALQFDDTLESTWTDLDLSSTVGSGNSFVVLKVKNNSAASNDVMHYVRPNGDTEDYTGESGAALAKLDVNKTALLVCETSAGIVEIQGEDVKAKIWLTGYMKQSD